MADTPNETGINAHEVLASGALDLVTNATLPIYFSVAGGELQFDRSAVLFRFGSHYFLLTAIHDLERLQRPDVRAFTSASDGNRAPIDITGLRITAIGEPIDVGILRLDPSVLHRLGAAKKAVTSRNIHLRDEWDETTPFILCGYPKEMQSPHTTPTGPLFVPRPFTLLTGGYVGAVEHPESFSRKVHLSVGWSREFRPVETDGKLMERDVGYIGTPKPYGISGGGIWRIGPIDGNDSGKYECRLTGIQHRVSRKMQYAIGTRIGMVLYLIWKAFPELQPLIEQELPNTFPVDSPLS